jgi:ribosomal protein S18 acetylase RimI-like enzyme
VQSAGALFESLGYHVVRTFWEMEIDLNRELDAPGHVAGITIRTFDFERELRPLYDTLADGFSDHWGNVLSPFDRWRYRMIEAEGSGFDPNLWLVAVDGDQIVGAATSRSRSANREDTAEVDYIAVRSPWRRRGIALALLRTLFQEFRARGIPRAKLEVDADSATGATQLYERAGMHVALSWEFWEKELRAAGR